MVYSNDEENSAYHSNFLTLAAEQREGRDIRVTPLPRPPIACSPYLPSATYPPLLFPSTVPLSHCLLPPRRTRAATA